MHLMNFGIFEFFRTETRVDTNFGNSCIVPLGMMRGKIQSRYPACKRERWSRPTSIYICGCGVPILHHYAFRYRDRHLPGFPALRPASSTGYTFPRASIASVGSLQANSVMKEFPVHHKVFSYLSVFRMLCSKLRQYGDPWQPFCQRHVTGVHQWDVRS